MVGPISLSATQLLDALLHPAIAPEQASVVLWDLRLLASVMALLIGASLGLAGGMMQTILDNPLAEPFTLGISAAAAFGAAMSIVLGINLIAHPQFNLALAAALAALVAVAVVAAAAVWRGAAAETMILLGIALSFFFQALLSLMQYGETLEALQQIVFWTLGSMQRATWLSNAVIGALLVAAVPFVVLNAWRQTALRLGDARAASLGIKVSRLRVTALIVASLLAAASVAFAGVIGFIGLVGPHIARMLVGEDQKFYLPASAAAGALLLTAAHAVSITVKPGLVIPVGIINALVGVPFFVFLIFSRYRKAGH